MINAKKDISGGSIISPPAKGIRGTVTVPGDKSISHRSLIIGSIASGVTEVDGFLEGEDNLSTLNAMRLLGVKIERKEKNRVVVNGGGVEALREPSDVIDCLNSGTTARLLTGLLSAQPFFSVLTGDSSLRKRPMKRVVEPLSRMGALISGRREGSCLPLAITGRRLRGISYRTPMASAQLKSALLLAGLCAEGETIIEEPEKSRDHTERMLRIFGADVGIHENSIKIRSTKKLKGCGIVVPGDISSAAFFIVGAAITPESELLIKNAGINPTRTGILKIIELMGGSVKMLNVREVSGEPVADILVKSSKLKGIDIDGQKLLPAIDEFPIICIAAAFSDGTTTISGAGELRVKESDRIAVMAELLTSIGVEVKENEDGIIIKGIGCHQVKKSVIRSHGDHRIAMSAAIAALMSREGLEIDGAKCVDVSFPGFFNVLESVRAS